ncbi:MAG: hypothetical protein WDW36_005249 [Sanguina aurantia]
MLTMYHRLGPGWVDSSGGQRWRHPARPARPSTPVAASTDPSPPPPPPTAGAPRVPSAALAAAVLKLAAARRASMMRSTVAAPATAPLTTTADPLPSSHTPDAVPRLIVVTARRLAPAGRSSATPLPSAAHSTPAPDAHRPVTPPAALPDSSPESPTPLKRIPKAKRKPAVTGDAQDKDTASMVAAAAAAAAAGATPPSQPHTHTISQRVVSSDPSPPGRKTPTTRAPKAERKPPVRDPLMHVLAADAALPSPETYPIPKRVMPSGAPVQAPATYTIPKRSTPSESPSEVAVPYPIARRDVPLEGRDSDPDPDLPAPPGRTPKLQLKLRDYQEVCVAAVMKAYEGGSMAQIIEMPTGAGKTVVFANIIKRIREKLKDRAQPPRVLVIAHRTVRPRSPPGSPHLNAQQHTLRGIATSLTAMFLLLLAAGMDASASGGGPLWPMARTGASGTAGWTQQQLRRELGPLPEGLSQQLPSISAVCVETQELINQAHQKIEAWVGETVGVGIVQGKTKELEADVVVAMVQTLSKSERTLALLSEERFDVVIIDEVGGPDGAGPPRGGQLLHQGPQSGGHPAAKEHRPRQVRAGGGGRREGGPAPPPEAEPPDQWEHPPGSRQLLLGFSATPYRFDEQDLEQLFPHRVFKIGLKTLMDAGHLCTLTSQRVSTTADLTAVKMTKLSGEWDFNERQLSQVVNCEARNKLVADAYLEKAPGRSAIAFCVDTKHARDLCEVMVGEGIVAEVLTAKTYDREGVLRRFQEGATKVVVSVGVLLEGTDLPCITALLMCRCETPEGIGGRRRF